MIPHSLQSPEADQARILLWRRKSAMVLYELEMALGDFIRSEKLNIESLPTEAVARIQSREQVQ